MWCQTHNRNTLQNNSHRVCTHTPRSLQRRFADKRTSATRCNTHTPCIRTHKRACAIHCNISHHLYTHTLATRECAGKRACATHCNTHRAKYTHTHTFFTLQMCRQTRIYNTLQHITPITHTIYTHMLSTQQMCRQTRICNTVKHTVRQIYTHTRILHYRCAGKRASSRQPICQAHLWGDAQK